MDHIKKDLITMQGLLDKSFGSEGPDIRALLTKQGVDPEVITLICTYIETLRKIANRHFQQFITSTNRFLNDDPPPLLPS